ncbi:MAG: hypothetical protein JWM28_1557 [Chitinophagaceae bacterium]|nr:hypothetical protein [Chitinophagaceae bacterium]
MKKQFLRYLSGCIPAIALFTNVNAQSAKASLELNSKEYIFNEAKANLAIANEGNTANINTRAINEYSKSFKSADKASWFEMKDGFVAKFKEDGVETKVYYDLKGRWTGTIHTYNEDKLPKDIRKLVRSIYYDYSIFQVNEVIVGEKTAYLVRIEDAATFKTIRIIDGEMDVYEDYTKG